MMAASFVNGVQKGGIGTTIKHFVCVITTHACHPSFDLLFFRFSANDKEDDRFGYDSVVSARALREIYLMPFMLAQKFARPWAYMTA
jgi:beta-glucosidase